MAEKPLMLLEIIAVIGAVAAIIHFVLMLMQY